MSQSSPSPTEQQDLELMRRVARREPQAQRDLASRLVSRVRRLSQLLMDDSAEADDAAQLALMEILQGASGFRGEGSLEAWADRITARTTVRAAQRLRRQRSIFQRVADHEPLAHLLPQLRTRPADDADLPHFLSRLSANRREAFVLKYGLGYTVDEISELTRAPSGTVKDRLIMAKRQLRKMLARDGLITAREDSP